MLDFIHDQGRHDGTPQGIFNAAYIGVMMQGKQSKNAAGNCKYLSEDGHRCAVGFLVEEDVARAWDGEGGNSITSVSKLHGVPEWVKDNLDLLAALQEAHDDWTADDGYTFRQWFDTRARRIAAHYKLTAPDLGIDAMNKIDAMLVTV
jgi:hypothetical protein